MGFNNNENVLARSIFNLFIFLHFIIKKTSEFFFSRVNSRQKKKDRAKNFVTRFDWQLKLIFITTNKCH